MNTDASFPLHFVFEGVPYNGIVTPSNEVGRNAMPIYFKVSVGGVLFAYLCCGDLGWSNKDRPADHSDRLIQAIGEFIKGHYEKLNAEGPVNAGAY